MRILVLGGGAQGRVIAHDLASSMPDNTIWVADLNRPRLSDLPNLSWLEADLGSVEKITQTLEGFDLAVGALPSRLGYNAMKAAIAAQTNLVDVSFSAEDPLSLDEDAQEAGIAILPDCGLAPGLSNLVIGKAVAENGMPNELMIYVGGVAADPKQPYGYVVTWSLPDLLEEYTRPARIMEKGQPTTVPVFSGHEEIEVDGVGTMEAFFSDGLRTLIQTLPEVPTMGEKTLRWPGHARSIQPLLKDDRLISEFEKQCVVDEPHDLVALVIRVDWDERTETTTLVDNYDPETRLTAMSRTTAFTTSLIAQYAASGRITQSGVIPLERLAQDTDVFDFVMEAMARRGVRFALAAETV